MANIIKPIETNTYIKINANKLGPDMIGDIIQRIEEEPILNTDWIDTIITDKKNNWTVIFKTKAKYYPKSIIKYNKLTKSRVIKGKLFEIEEQLSNAFHHNEYKHCL